jgi:hypothetical protein
VAVAALGGAAHAGCLPPLFDGGRRLHDLRGATLFDIDVMLSQHELCHRARDGVAETRVLLFGNSAIFGARLTEDQTVAHLLNDSLARDGADAHVYNLGYATTYQLKEAMLMRASLRFDPDVIVYGVTLADFMHVTPILWPPGIAELLLRNPDWLETMAREGAPGIDDLVESYVRPGGDSVPMASRWLRRWRALGSYARVAARRHAQRAATSPWLGGGVDPDSADDLSPPIMQREDYTCGEVLESFARNFRGWRTWNTLEYLESLAERVDARVVVVAWPIRHDPKGACYNWRYPKRAVAEFDAWLRDEAERRGFSFVDLHDALGRSAFVDSLHPTPSGNEEVVSRLRTVLRSELDDHRRRSH